LLRESRYRLVEVRAEALEVALLRVIQLLSARAESGSLELRLGSVSARGRFLMGTLSAETDDARGEDVNA
jgi:hypothetical protein